MSLVVVVIIITVIYMTLMVRNKLFKIQALKTISIYLAHEFMFKYVSDLGWMHRQVQCQLAVDWNRGGHWASRLSSSSWLT